MLYMTSSKLVIMTLTFVLLSICSFSLAYAEEIMLTEAQRAERSNLVFHGKVKSFEEVGQISDTESLWVAKIEVFSVSKGAELVTAQEVELYFGGPKDGAVRVCPEPVKLSADEESIFYATFHEVPAKGKVLFLYGGSDVQRPPATNNQIEAP